MGGAQSSGVFSGIPSAPTGNEFSQHAKTKEIKEMSDALFQFMYSKWDIREVFEITEKPGDYVIAISDLITSEFHVLGYTTKKNKIGEIYFQKWEKLDPPQSAEDLSALRTSYSSNVTRSARLKKKEEKLKKMGVNSSRGEPGAKTHHQHAKIISFYFVVIFQILGSLLLVLKDTELPMLNSSGEYISDSSSVSERAYAQQATLPLFKPISGGGQTYYTLSEPLGGFEFLRYYLRNYDKDEVERYSKELKLELPPPGEGFYKFANNDSLLFNFKKLESATSVQRGETAQLYIFVKTEKGDTYIKKNIEIKIQDIIPATRSEYKPPIAYSKEQRINVFPFEVVLETKLKRSGTSNPLTTAVFQKNDETDMNRDYERGVKYKIITSDKDKSSFYDIISSSSEKIGSTEMDKILEKFILVTLNKTNPETFYPFKIKSSNDRERNSRGDYVKRVEAPKFNPALSETFTSLNNLAPTNSSPIGYKHVPHCIKRAQDLLNLRSINDFSGLKPAETRICSSDINGRAASYVPLKSIASLYGKLNAGAVINVDEVEFNKAMKVLDAFVGKGSKGYMTVSELKESGQESEANSLSAALKRLSISFSQLKEDSALNKLDDVLLYKPRRCAGKEKVIQSVDTSRPAFKNMQAYSRKLLGFHLNNVINISKFLMTIFNVSQRPDGSWKVEGPKTEILFAGFSVLDVLKDQARELLLSYYTGCEDIYQKGVKEWNDDVDAPKVPGVASKPSAGPDATSSEAALVAAPVASAGKL